MQYVLSTLPKFFSFSYSFSLCPSLVPNLIEEIQNGTNLEDLTVKYSRAIVLGFFHMSFV